MDEKRLREIEALVFEGTATVPDSAVIELCAEVRRLRVAQQFKPRLSAVQSPDMPEPTNGTISISKIRLGETLIVNGLTFRVIP